ncbi:MAG: TolC family protein [Synergistaceae bacterium]
MIRKIITAFILILTISSPIYAQDNILDIKKAVEITLEKNASLRSLREEIRKAEAFRLKADGTWLPSVRATGQMSKQKEPVITTDNPNKQDTKSATAILSQTLYSGGKDSAIRRQASQKKNIAQLMIENGENSVIGELFAKFYSVLLNKEKIVSAQSSVKTSELHLKQVRKMSELGLANKLDIIRAAQQFAKNTAELSTAQGRYEASFIALKNYMALTPDSNLVISSDLSVPEPNGDKTKSISLAKEHRADFKQLQEELKLYGNQISIEKSGLIPTVTFNATGGRINPYARHDTNGDTWKADITVSVPIFDKNITRSNVMTATADLNKSKISKEQKELDILSEVETAWTEIGISSKHLTASKKSLDLAKESLRLAQVGYEEGVTPQIDLLQAQTTYTEATSEYITSKYNHLITIVALKMTEGNIKDWVRGSDFNEIH